MLSTRKRSLLVGLLACVAGTVFQFLPTGCANYATQLGLSAFDFCAVFNCEGGTFFDPCHPFALLMDCPDVVQATGG